MPLPTNANRKRRPKRLYRAAKISDFQFRKLLWHFALDHSAGETSAHVNVSANSISLIFAKLRKFFFDHGLFRDPYKGGDPANGIAGKDAEDVEYRLLDFHLRRVSAKHGSLDSPADAPDYHFAESNWRSDFAPLMSERGPDLVHQMMFDNLLEFVRCFGPVGATGDVAVERKLEGRRLALAQFDRRILWLERNAVRFREARSELKGLREQ